MVVIGNDNTTARANSMHHLRNRLSMLWHVLEHEARVDQIEARDLALIERQRQRVTEPKRDQIGLASICCQPNRCRQLLLVAFDADHRRSPIQRGGHCPGELTEPTSHIEDAFGAREVNGLDAPLVEQVVEARQPLLFFGRASVDVVTRRIGTHRVPSSNRTRPQASGASRIQ